MHIICGIIMAYTRGGGVGSMLPRENFQFFDIRGHFRPLEAVSEYSTQISLLQLYTCVIAKVKFQGGQLGHKESEIPPCPFAKRNPERILTKIYVDFKFSCMASNPRECKSFVPWKFECVRYTSTYM